MNKCPFMSDSTLESLKTNLSILTFLGVLSGGIKTLGQGTSKPIQLKFRGMWW